jgi:PhnB protein
MSKLTLIPRLVIRDTPRAIAWYVEHLGAREIERHADGATIVHVELELGGSRVFLTEETPGWRAFAPPSLGGSPVILYLYVDAIDELGARMERGGAKVIYPIRDQEYGERSGRFEDPFGHLWILSRKL